VFVVVKTVVPRSPVPLPVFRTRGLTAADVTAPGRSLRLLIFSSAPTSRTTHRLADEVSILTSGFQVAFFAEAAFSVSSASIALRSANTWCET
jgi:hypothetical protein